MAGAPCLLMAINYVEFPNAGARCGQLLPQLKQE